MSHLSFLANAIKHPVLTGSPLPSQYFFIKKMITPIPSGRNPRIIELGAGSGCVTRQIVNKAGADAHLFVFEINKSFVEEIEKMTQTMKYITLIHDDAMNLSAHLTQYDIKEVDYIISSLPLAHMSKKKVFFLLHSIKKHLHKEGCFIQYQYSLKSKRALQRVFSHVDISFTPLNFPPAFVYYCRK